MSEKRILLIGRTGQLGTALAPMLGDLGEVYSPDRSDLDLGSVDTIRRAIGAFKPTHVFNTAAYHRVPDCELFPEEAFRVNVLGQRYLAQLCSEYRAKLVTYSTDYVFDGEKRAPYVETDAANPIQMYGIIRLAGEQAVRAVYGEGSWLIRTCGVFGRSSSLNKGKNFLDARIDDFSANDVIEISSDQTVSPTYSQDLATASIKLIFDIEAGSGIYHLSNAGACTWFELTEFLAKQVKTPCRVRPVDRGGRTGNMKRPPYSALSCKKAQELGILMPTWQDAVLRYLKYKERC